jgi:Cu-Zn family superoxide dismutase
MKRLSFLPIAAAAATGCATLGSPPTAIPLMAADGRQVGTVQLVDDGAGLTVRARASGLAAGIHGIHIHAVGRCEGPDFSSAGPHWNPRQREHGTANPQGPHLGDLPNMPIGANGTGSVEFQLAGSSLRSGPTPLLDADGASVVLHEKADDYRTDPSGNSGSRIACAVLN